MSHLETERQLRLLTIVRVVTVTSLLFSAFAIEILIRPVVSLGPLFRLSAVAYGLVLVHAAADRMFPGRPLRVYSQLLGDAFLVTAFVSITGGAESPMSFLYLLPIGVGSLLRYRRGGLAMAGACWAFYALLVLMPGGFSPLGRLMELPPAPDVGRGVYDLVTHLVAFVSVGLLTSYVTERMRAQDDELAERRGAVARLQALNENIIESINSGLVTTDLSGVVNFMNRGGAEITGFGAESVRGHEVEGLFGFAPGFLKEIRRQLVENRRFRFERDFETGSGETIFLGIAVSNLYDRGGHPLGFIFIFQDLTEIQALETEVRLRERMAALGEMAAGMAHELRNPLAAISGSVQYLKGEIRPRGETLELMDIILRESQRLDQAIRDFLTFARPGRFHPEPADVVKLIEENLKLLSKSRETRPDHRVERGFESESIEAVLDVNRMKQVFWNLATNGLKSMPNGGTLRVEVGTADGGENVVVRFVDQGQGMTAAQREKYFQPFQSSFREGTGLGAAIVYRLVQEHDGRIEIESRPDEGTTVSVSIPRRLSRSSEARPPMAKIAAAGGARA